MRVRGDGISFIMLSKSKLEGVFPETRRLEYQVDYQDEEQNPEEFEYWLIKEGWAQSQRS